MHLTLCVLHWHGSRVILGDHIQQVTLLLMAPNPNMKVLTTEVLKAIWNFSEHIMSNLYKKVVWQPAASHSANPVEQTHIPCSNCFHMWSDIQYNEQACRLIIISKTHQDHSRCWRLFLLCIHSLHLHTEFTFLCLCSFWKTEHTWNIKSRSLLQGM